MNQSQFISDLERISKEIIEIVKLKNSDYSSPEDQLSNFRNSQVIGLSVNQAIMSRMIDKISRLATLEKQEAAVTEESRLDTARDIVGYALLLAFSITHEEKQL